MKNKINQKMMLAIVAVGFFSAAFSQESKKTNPGINFEFVDTKVKPGDDFFRYVNGTWFDKTEIPVDRTRWVSFDEPREKTDKHMVVILYEALKNPKYKDDTDQDKALNLFRSIMDTVARDKQGIKPLKPFLDKINAVKSIADLQKLLIEMDNQGGIGFFGVSVGTDAKNSNRNLVNVGLGSLGLPNRDYYLSDEADSKEKIEKYMAHVARMLQYLGESPAQVKVSVDRVLAIEKALATPRLDRVERRDHRKTYNPLTVADLQTLTPSINWNTFTTQIGLPKIDTLIVSQPRYMTALQTIFKRIKKKNGKPTCDRPY